ncbi:MAG: hypothetical protein K5851_07705 [Lachnospiraceae bacterium]|nr:hypothetical protein [Lachnospiraceae bacterium]
MHYKQKITLNTPEESKGVEIMPNKPLDEEPTKKRKKKKKSAFRYYFFNIVLGIILVIMLAYILSVSVFITTKVTVSGSTIYDENYIKSKAIHKGEYKKNSIYQVVMGIIDEPRDIPFIESIKVGLKSPSHVNIYVKEKEMLGVIQADDGKYVYFDDDGIVKEIAKKKLDKVIPVSGLVATKPKIGKSLSIDKDALKTLLNVVKALHKYKIDVDEVKFHGKSRISCQCGKIEVDFGNFKYLDEKMMRFDIILKKIKGRTGKLHLENWTPETTDVVFEIKE